MAYSAEGPSVCGPFHGHNVCSDTRVVASTFMRTRWRSDRHQVGASVEASSPPPCLGQEQTPASCTAGKGLCLQPSKLTISLSETEGQREREYKCFNE